MTHDQELRNAIDYFDAKYNQLTNSHWAPVRRALSARASAGEGGELTVDVSKVSAAEATALGNADFANFLRYLAGGELHESSYQVTFAEAARRIATAPQPAQAGASGGGEPDLRKYRGVAQMAIDYASLVATPVDEDLARELLAVIDHKHDLTHNPDTGVVKCYGCNYESRETTTPASPATGMTDCRVPHSKYDPCHNCEPDDTPPAHGDGEGDCSCPSGDGSLRWPCPKHPPGIVLPEPDDGSLNPDTMALLLASVALQLDRAENPTQAQIIRNGVSVIRYLTARPAPDGARFTQADLNAEYTLGRNDGFNAACKPLTYKNQPDNVGAWRLGEACRTAAADPKCGDPIDRGLILLRELQSKGYGVVSLPAQGREGGRG